MCLFLRFVFFKGFIFSRGIRGHPLTSGVGRSDVARLWGENNENLKVKELVRNQGEIIPTSTT